MLPNRIAQTTNTSLLCDGVGMRSSCHVPDLDDYPTTRTELTLVEPCTHLTAQ